MQAKAKPLIIKKCHLCSSLIESYAEVQKCPSCHHAFLPTNYCKKVHAKNSREFALLFDDSSELNEKDLIRGISVLW